MSDEQSLSEARLCEIVGVQRATRRLWAKRGLVRGGLRQYEERDAVELALLRLLSDALGPTDGAVAWTQLRQHLATTPEDANDEIAFDLQFKEAEFITSDADVCRFVRRGRAVKLIQVGGHIRDVRAAFQRVATIQRTTP